MKQVLLSVLFSISMVSAAGFTDAGTMETGGRFSFTSIDYGESRGHSVVLQPIFNVYVVDQLYIAAKLHLESQDGGGFFGIGAGVGYAFLPGKPVVPYIEGGIEFVHSSWGEGAAGVALPISGGIKIPVYPHVTVDLNLGLYPKFIEDYSGVDFGLAGGVTIPIF